MNAMRDGLMQLIQGPTIPHGSIPALPTPFLPENPCTLDTESLARLATRAVAAGSGGVVVCGSTGEGPALRPTEHALAIRAVARAVGGRVPVIAGVGAPATEAAMALAEAAERCGATGLLVSPPPYIRPTQEGLRAHLRAIAAVCGLPITLYDVPSRAGVAFADETIARLRDEGLCTGLKDATADLARPLRLRRLCGADFLQFSGDDATALAHRAMGGQGCISVSANVVPGLCAALHAAWDHADMAEATRLNQLLAPLHEAMFLEPNPIPVKAALGLLKLCDPVPRLPLMRAAKTTCAHLLEVVPSLVAQEEALREALRPIARRRRLRAVG